MIRFTWLALASFPILTLLAGCSGSGTVKVDGVVTLDGKPLANATVTFHSADGKGRTAIGTTDAQGAFTLTSYSADDGIVPGDYKVVVFASGNAGAGDKLNMDGARRQEELKTAIIHANYGNLAKTPLQRKIDGKAKVDIPLKSDGT